MVSTGTKGDHVSRDGLADLNENWATWLHFTAEHAPGGISRTFGTIRCSSVGVAMPLFNQAFVFEKPSKHDMTRATGWLSERNVPFWVTTPDSVAPEMAHMTELAGLNPTAMTTPGMAYTPLADLPAPVDGDAEILMVTQPAQLDDFAIVASEAFGAPLEAAGMLAPASTLGDDRCSWFLAYLDGDPAASGQLFRTGDVAGVYSIGVRERFRRRGLGATITAAALAAGRDTGCSIGVLQASPMGEPVYDRMGFETVTDYRHFAPNG
jgi:GNAT superfamily N-acetyltransferase